MCYLQQEAEARCLENLLWQDVNALVTRARWAAGLGFRERHAWPLQGLEAGGYGDGLGNVILYEGLLQRVSPLHRQRTHSLRLLHSEDPEGIPGL
jgi:hypothetical protein